MRRNKSFPTQFGGDKEMPDVEETLEFWRMINNKEVTDGLIEDDPNKMSSGSDGETPWKNVQM